MTSSPQSTASGSSSGRRSGKAGAGGDENMSGYASAESDGSHHSSLHRPGSRSRHAGAHAHFDSQGLASSSSSSTPHAVGGGLTSSAAAAAAAPVGSHVMPTAATYAALAEAPLTSAAPAAGGAGAAGGAAAGAGSSAAVGGGMMQEDGFIPDDHDAERDDAQHRAFTASRKAHYGNEFLRVKALLSKGKGAAAAGDEEEDEEDEEDSGMLVEGSAAASGAGGVRHVGPALPGPHSSGGSN